jgi:hypothetical protein
MTDKTDTTSRQRGRKPVPRRDNPSACLAIRHAVRPILLLPSCLGETNHGRTGRLGAVRGLGRTAEVSRQTCRSKWKLRCREFAACRNAVSDASSARSSPLLSCDAARVSWDGAPVIRRKRERRRQRCPFQKCVSRLC